jgi:hypothetical protein
MPYAQYKRCKIIAKGPEDQAMPLCFSCYTQDLERARAVEELKRVQTKAREQEKRRSLHAEQRQVWIEHGFALSNFSSEDSSKQDNREYQWDWGQDNDINYSTHS